MKRLIFLFYSILTSTSLYAFDLIAHRGASGYLPEHTSEALILAFMQGADYIEQDLVLSKDGHLIVLHDIYLENVTNVEQMFPHRKRDDGRYYVIDFSLAELRLLDVHERTNAEGKAIFEQRYMGKSHFKITKFTEQIELLTTLNKQFNKNVGLYPEIKAPDFHLSHGQDITQQLIKVLDAYDLNRKEANLIVQCFNPATLQRIRSEFKSELTLVQLIAENAWAESTADYQAMMTKEGLLAIKKYADGIGPWIPHLLNDDLSSTGLAEEAASLELIIHPYTFRMDAPSFDQTPHRLFARLRDLPIHGLFSDHIETFMRSPDTRIK